MISKHPRLLLGGVLVLSLIMFAWYSFNQYIYVLAAGFQLLRLLEIVP
jgi:hypothetical protein